MRMFRDMFKSQATIEAEQAAVVDAGIKDGTIGRVINDREDQVRVVKYRQEQAAKQKAQQAEVDMLNARRQMAKDFQDRQALETAQTQANFAPAKMSAVQERLSLWKPKRLRTEDVEMQVLEDSRSLRLRQ